SSPRFATTRLAGVRRRRPADRQDQALGSDPIQRWVCCRRSPWHHFRTSGSEPRQAMDTTTNLEDLATAFEAVLLIKPPALPGVSDSNRRRQNRTLRRQHLSAHEGEESVRSSLRQAHHRRSGFEFRNQRRIALREQKESH